MNYEQPKNKNDKKWELLFKQHDVINIIEAKGVYQISASTINEVREARLMTKFDHRVNLPRIFRENHLTILPDSRGTYLIGRFDAYHKSHTSVSHPIVEIPFPSAIETIDYENLYSEASAILCAYNVGIISDLLEEAVNFTVFGRMSTSQFDFRIKQENTEKLFSISVNNAQCEIDGGFEGETRFAIVEAKNYHTDDFLIRQLYYPYRLWKQKISKIVIPIFMTYSNDIFTFQVYEFEDEYEYNSIKLVKQQSYQIAPEAIELKDIHNVYQVTRLQSEPQGVPFPQANKFNRIVDLLGLLYSNDLSQHDITSLYQFDMRQTNYYADATIYLGLVEKQYDSTIGVHYSLTALGKSILEKDSKRKNLAIVGQILCHQVFRQALELYFAKGERPSKEEIVEIMRNANLNLGDSTTIPRRAQTVLAWIDWILRLSRVGS